MTEHQSVPRLDLAPKLRRPLSLWNPLDYLRLLYWVFFFPQALHWYTRKFSREFLPNENPQWKNVWGILPNPILRQLLLQGIVLVFITTILQGIIFKSIGFTLDFSIILISPLLVILVGLFILFISYSISIEAGKKNDIENKLITIIPIFIALSVTFNLAYSILSAPIKEIFTNLPAFIALVIVGGAWFGVSYITAVAMLLNVIDLEYIVFAGIFFVFPLSVIFAITIPISQLGLELGILKTLLYSLVSATAFIFSLCVAFIRLDNWLISLKLTDKLSKNNIENQLPHISPIPITYLFKTLKSWLRHDWELGIINAKQIFVYTFQGITVIKALNQVLAETPLEQVIYRVAKLAEPPYNWELVRYVSCSLFNNPFNFRLDTPARATAAGFWFLHEKNLSESTKAFAVVRSLPYGQEMYILTLTLFNFAKVRNLDDIVQLEIPIIPKEPLLRPGTWKVISSLCRVAEDIKVIQNSSSRSARAFALSRAIGELKKLRDKDSIVPELERELINKIVIHWSVNLINIATEVGQIRIDQRVINPYIVGDPVQGNLFIGREDIIRQLEELWVMGHQLQSVVLYGHRRMGKTSILINAASSLGSGIQLVYVNLLRLGDTPQGVGEVLMAITDEISQAVKIPPPPDADLLNLPYRTFERYLKQVEAQLEGGLIIALDEFEKIEELIEAGRIPQDFMGFLRGLVQMSSKVAFAFAGLHTLEEMKADYFHPFFGSVIDIPVGFLKRAATRQVLANPDDDFLLDYTSEALDEIYALTSGQPYLVQWVGFQLVRRYNDFVFEQGRSRNPVFTVEDVAAVINDSEFFKRGRYYFDGVWGQAMRGADGQQAIIQVLAPHPEGLSLDALAQSTGMGAEELQAAIAMLTRHDVVAQTEGRWRIIVELFRRWVLQSHPL